MPPRPTPFAFVGCIELREILGRRARDERELMEELEQVPAESIYYHTDSVFLRRASGAPSRQRRQRFRRSATTCWRNASAWSVPVWHLEDLRESWSRSRYIADLNPSRVSSSASRSSSCAPTVESPQGQVHLASSGARPPGST